MDKPMNKIHNVGYHGTTQENAERILREKRFVDSNKDNEWLGRGVYFFAYPGDAAWWVSVGRLKDQETAIIKADLAYTEEQALDLDDHQQLEAMNKILCCYVKAQSSRSGISVNISGAEHYKQLCWACNLIKKLEPRIGIIIYTFSQKQPYKYLPFAANQKQICVSDHSIIKHISRAEG